MLCSRLVLARGKKLLYHLITNELPSFSVEHLKPRHGVPKTRRNRWREEGPRVLREANVSGKCYGFSGRRVEGKTRGLWWCFFSGKNVAWTEHVIAISVLKGYVCRISGGNDKQGFPMKQGILTAGRVRLLLSKGHSCYRPRRSGERRRKSVRGCIVDANLSVLNLVIVKKGKHN